jgi:hypothetical protein
MATSDAPADTEVVHPDVMDDVQTQAQHNTCVRTLLQYLQGDLAASDVSMQQDIVPALQDLDGHVVIRFRHTAKVEYIWPADVADTVSSCYHDTGEEFMCGTPVSRDELDKFRSFPCPGDFLPAANVEHVRPERARGGAE